jgi:uncharacterized membrane protein (DUF2068 family)
LGFVLFDDGIRLNKLIMLGEFSPSLFFNVSAYILIASLFAIYLIAIALNHEQPIPKTFISACADHYPEFILFRISTIAGSALVLLGWLANHFFLKSVAREKTLRLGRYRPEVSLILGMMGAMCLMGSTANIDTGVHNGHWHQRCAASFFLLTSLAIFYNTFLCWVVYSKASGITATSMAVKAILTLLMILQMAISWKYGESGTGGQIRSDIGNIIEWTYSFTIAFVYLSMGSDAKAFMFVYEYSSQSEKDYIDRQ